MWKKIKKNGVTIILGIGVIFLIVHPQAKSWILRRLMVTGIFNAHIESEKEESEHNNTVSLQFRNENGRIISTDSLKGQVVFINFWASWCPPCRAEMPSIQKMKREMEEEEDFRLIMVNVGEEQSKAKSYLKNEGYNFSINHSQGVVPETIYSGTLPTTVILDKNGSIRYHHSGAANYDSQTFLKQIKELLME